MKKFVIDRQSWHYRFLLFWGMNHWTMPQDFCSYWRKFSLFSLLTIAVLAILSGLLFLLGLGIYSNPVVFGQGVLGFVAFCAFFAAVFGLVYGTYALYKKTKNKAYSFSKEHEDSFLVTRYKSWKDQYCPMIEYK